MNIQIDLGNLFELIKCSPSLCNLRLIFVDLIEGNKNSAFFKQLMTFNTELKKLCIYECSDSVSSFLHSLPGKSIEELFIRAKNIENLKKFIQKHKQLKRLNLQLLECQEAFDRDLLHDLELTHLTLYTLNKDNMESIVEKQNSLQCFDSKMRLSNNVIKKLSAFEGIEIISFIGDRVEIEDIDEIAKWKHLKTVMVDFKPHSKVKESVLAAFFRNGFKYSLHFEDNATKQVYTLSKPNTNSSA